MSMVERVRAEMVAALKAGDKIKKNSLALLVASLDKAAKEKKADLTEVEENQIVLKTVKQIQETIDTCPSDRNDILDQAKAELAAVSVFAPKMMDEKEISDVIEGVLMELGISNPTMKDKGSIMKVLMPRVKGKADGKLVNSVLEKYFNG